MRITKTIAAATGLLALSTLAGCGILSNEHVETASRIIEQMQAQGSVTAEQAEALRQALQANTGEPWYTQLGRVVLEVGLAVVGVRMWRGPSATTAERVARLTAPK
jgi:hypothetical protein